MSIPEVKPFDVPEPCVIRRDDIKDVVVAVSEDRHTFGFASVDATLGRFGLVSARRWQFMFKYMISTCPSVAGNRAHYVATGRWP
jgi:hypothetical protein